MKFELSVKPQSTKWNEEYTEIRTTTELTIFSEDYKTEFEKDCMSFCITMRQMLYMFYMPFGIVTQIGDMEFIKMYEVLCERKEILSITIYVEEIEQIHNESNGKHKKDINCDVTLNMFDQSERSDLFIAQNKDNA